MSQFHFLTGDVGKSHQSALLYIPKTKIFSKLVKSFLNGLWLVANLGLSFLFGLTDQITSTNTSPAFFAYYDSRRNSYIPNLQLFRGMNDDDVITLFTVPSSRLLQQSLPIQHWLPRRILSIIWWSSKVLRR